MTNHDVPRFDGLCTASVGLCEQACLRCRLLLLHLTVGFTHCCGLHLDNTTGGECHLERKTAPDSQLASTGVGWPVAGLVWTWFC